MATCVNASRALYSRVDIPEILREEVIRSRQREIISEQSSVGSKAEVYS